MFVSTAEEDSVQSIGRVGLLQDEHVELIWRELQEHQETKQSKHRHSILQRGRLTHEYIDPIASRRWKVVLSWVAFHPDQLSTFTDRSGQTALHHTILFRAPAVIVEAMLYSSSPEMASYANDEGELALHWAVRLAAPSEILQLLVHAYPEGGCHADASGQTPLSLLWDRHKDSLLGHRTNQEQLEKSNAWKSMLLLVESCSGLMEQGIDMNEYPLHALAASPCPPGMIDFALNVYREELDIFDLSGRLPLTLACAAPRVGTPNIQLLLDANPVASGCTDDSERLPLHWATSSGKSWASMEAILQSEPRAVRARDPVTKLYPFQLAATSQPLELATSEQSDSDINVIYRMLLACPECVQPFS